MSDLFEWPEDIQDTLFNQDAPFIFRYVESAHAFAITPVAKWKQSGDLVEETADPILETIESNMTAGRQARFTLGTVDNKLKRERSSNFTYKRFANELKRDSKEDDMMMLLTILEDESNLYFPFEIFEIVNNLVPMINDSLACRIELCTGWMKILENARKLWVHRMIVISHRITEVSLHLQNKDTIQEVRDMLGKLDLTLPPDLPYLNLPDNPAELKKMLMQGIQDLGGMKGTIENLDNQMAQLSKTKIEIVKQYNKVGGESGGTGARGAGNERSRLGEHKRASTRASGMSFVNRRR